MPNIHSSNVHSIQYRVHTSIKYATLNQYKQQKDEQKQQQQYVWTRVFLEAHNTEPHFGVS